MNRGPCCLASTEGYVKTMVHKFGQSFHSVKERNLFIMRIGRVVMEKKYYFALYLTNHEKKLGQVSSLFDREPLSIKVFWEETKPHLTLLLYVVKPKSTSKRNVLILLTMLPILGVIKDDGKKKPTIIKCYDFTKRGENVIDQKMGNTA